LDLNEARDDGVLGISWTICKQSSLRSGQITAPTPHHSTVTGRMLFLTPNRQYQSTGGDSTEGKTASHIQIRAAFLTAKSHLYMVARKQFPESRKDNGSPYSITERRVPEPILVLGSQPAGDVSHKPGSRLPLLSARPAVTLADATLQG